MNVYLLLSVWHGNVDEHEVVAVFATREAAEATEALLNDCDGYIVQEWKLLD